MIGIALTAVAILATLWAWSLAAQRHLNHINLYKKYSEEFYRNSKTLMSDPETPRDIIELLLFMNEKMPKTSSARNFLASIVFGGETDASMRKTYDEINDFFKRRPQLEGPFEKACQSALRALSYRSLFAGFLIRRLFLFDDSTSVERPAQLVVQVEKRFRMDNHRSGVSVGC